MISFLTEFTIKGIWLGLMLYFYVPLNAQIIVEEGEENQVTKEQLRISTYAGTEFYLGMSPTFTYRSLVPNKGFFGKELGGRADEVGQFVSSYHSGLRSLLTETFLLDIGLSWSQNREFFLLDKPDTLYEYTNTYRHIAFPLQVGFQYGKSISFIGTAGVMAKAFLSERRDLRFREPNGFIKEEKIIAKEGYDLFLIDAVANIGVRLELSDNYGFYFMTHGFYQFSNNYTKQGPYIRNPYGIGINFGLHFYL